MQHAYDEILDFVTSGPSLEQIVDFTYSVATLERLAYLLDHEALGFLSDDEREELVEFRKCDVFMDQLRIRAQRRLIELQSA